MNDVTPSLSVKSWDFPERIWRRKMGHGEVSGFPKSRYRSRKVSARNYGQAKGPHSFSTL